MRAYSYIRFSTPEQAEGDSLRRQTEATERYCERNNLTLDRGLSLRDLGVSAYSGRNMDRGALSLFLQAVRSGRVPRGSILIVEALDRLSRANLERADELFRELLKASIDIVVLRTERRYSRASLSDPMHLSELQWTFHLAHTESKQKSERIGAAWGNKRRLARAGVVQSRATYRWLEVRDGKYHVIEKRAEIVRDIFRRVADGESVTAIVRRLNDSVPCFGRQSVWSTGYALKILHSRATVGELQPRRKRNGRWESDGPTVPGYYPAVVDEPLFTAAQIELSRKNRPRGPAGANVANLFTGLLFADDETPIHLTGNHPRQWMVSSGALRGKAGCRYVTFPYRAWETTVLALVRELTPTNLMRTGEPAENRNVVAELSGRLEFIESQIARIRRRLDTEDSEELFDMLSKREKEKRDTVARRDAVAAEQTNTPADSLGSVQAILPLLARTPADELPALRAKLKRHIRQLVARIDVSLSRDAIGRRCKATIQFRDGVSLPVVVRAGRKAVGAASRDAVLVESPLGRRVIENSDET